MPLAVSYACVDVDDAYLNAVPFYEKNGFRFMNAEDDDRIRDSCITT
jgi:hypothetical protein